jgi:hypothetical protein
MTVTQAQNLTSVGARGAGAPAEVTPGTANLTPGTQLAASFRELLFATLDRATEFATDKVEQAAQALERVAQDGGPKMGALLGGVQAKLAGRNPVWGALTGAFGSMSLAARIGLLVLLILALVLLPVTLVLSLLVLIVLVIILIARARSAS